MSSPGRSDDILIDAPLVQHTDVVPATEDRAYFVFIAGALASAIAIGFALGVVLSLAQAGLFWEERTPWVIQAHGWAQLEGWAGLFVAGMGFRLLPRFAGRRPAPKILTLATFALLFTGMIVRTIGQLGAGSGPSAFAVLAGQISWAGGALVFALVVAVTTIRGRARGRREPWSLFAMAGAGWWLAWSVTSVIAGVRAAGNDAYIPVSLDESMTWMVMLGAIGNFIWGVQSRAVPIFFGRKPPSLRKVIVPGLLLNAGVALLFVAEWMNGDFRERAVAIGFILCGAALVWLAPVAGSCWGKATRLRPRARAAARFVLFANLAAVACGLLLLWSGTRSLADGGYMDPGVRDAARHLFGVGVITLLVVGMAQLVAPFFALQRVEPNKRWFTDHGTFWLLAAAVVLRLTSGLLWGHIDNDIRMHLAAAAGVLAWLGLVIFALTVIQAVRSESRIKAKLASAVTKRTGSM